MEKKIIVITGAAGFIGYHLARSFMDDRNYQIILIDDFSRGKHDKEYMQLVRSENCLSHILDLTDINKTNETLDNIVNRFGKIDIIYHLAAINGTKNFYNNPIGVIDVNVNSCLNLLNWINKENCKKFVFTSSCEAYYGTINKFSLRGELFPTKEDIPLAIDDIYNPRVSYGASKIIGESLVINACRNKLIEFNILRYHNIYGIRMGDCHVIPELITKIEKCKDGDVLELKGGYQTRSFMYINDCVRDTRLVGESEFSGEIFNIGVQKEIQIEELAKKLIHFSGKDLTIDEFGAPEGSVKRRLPDMSKFKEYFGRKRYVDFNYGLLETYVWYKGGK